MHANARFYNDTWGVTSGDAELAYSQYIGTSLLLRVHARVFQQSAATFFKDAFFYQTESSAGAYWTGDRELAASRNEMVGAKLTLISAAGDTPVWHLFDRLDFNVKADIHACSTSTAGRHRRRTTRWASAASSSPATRSSTP